MLAPSLQVVASDLTLGWLNIDPTFVLLKGDPRLDRLLRSGAQSPLS